MDYGKIVLATIECTDMHIRQGRLLFTLIILAITGRLSADTGTILVLHSNHQGYEWVTAVNHGIVSVLRGFPEAELAFEYLDAQRNSPETFDAVANLLDRRYAARLPIAIIAVDDDALRFLIARRSALFPDIPVLFCGINDISVYEKPALSGMTGITESPDIHGTIALALQVLPQTDTILALADDTTAGKLNMGRFDRAAASLPSSVQIIRSIAPEPFELSETLSLLPEDSIVLYLSWLRTGAGYRMTVKDSVSRVVAASPVPVFGCWDFIVEAGAFGGRVVSGRLQGIAAAERALRVIRGEAADSIPITEGQAYEKVLDYAQFSKRSLKRSLVPADGILLGKPAPLPLFVSIGLIILSIVIGLEALTLLLVLRGRKLLAVAESRYRILAEQVPAVVFAVELGDESRTRYVSPKLKDVLGYEPDDWITNRTAWMESIYPEDKERVLSFIHDADEAGQPYSLEYRVISATGSLATMQTRGAYYDDHNGKRFLMGIMLDVSEERAARENQKAALAEKELLLKEIHHRVKNNFQIISSLLRLEQDRVPEGPARSALTDAERRIFAMALVHESIYQQGDLGHIDFRPYVQRIGQELMAMNNEYGSISFAVKGDELLLGLDVAVPLGLFLNEALLNAFKHAFPVGFVGEKTVLVRITNNSSVREVNVQDSGIGMPADGRPGATDAAAPRTSLGLTLMHLLANQLGGALTFEGDHGTTVRLCLPLLEVS